MLWFSVIGCFFLNNTTSFTKECPSSQYLYFKGIIDFYLVIEKQNVTVNKKEHFLLNVNSKKLSVKEIIDCKTKNNCFLGFFTFT